MDNFDAYITDLKAAVDLVEVISQDEQLTQRGREWRGTRHDSIQVTPERGLWNWHSRHIGGDVFSWCKEIRGWGFKRAVEELARLHGIEAPDWQRGDAASRLAAHARYDVMTVTARFWVREFRKNEDAGCYCSARGWTDETVKAEGLGFWNGDKAALLAEFEKHAIATDDPVAMACLRVPAGMLIYPHLEYGRVVYFSTRSISEKRHYNPPRDLVGDRKLRWNNIATPGHGEIVVVEGQADAVTLAQWGIPAVAMCGVNVGDTGEGTRILHLLSKHESIIIGADSDGAGENAIRKLATALGPMVRVLTWPDHDANDWLQNAPEEATAEAATALLENAEPYIMTWARRIGGMETMFKSPQLSDMIKEIARWMNDAEQSVFRRPVAEAAGISVKTFDRLLTTAKASADDDGDDEESFTPYTTIGGFVDGNLLETLYIPPPLQPANAVVLDGGSTMFAIRDENGNIETAPFFDNNGMRFFPVSPSASVLREGVLMLPRSIGPLLSTRAIIDQLKALIHKYVDIDEFYETLSAYYILFTWFFDCFPTLSYLRVKGDAGSGKTRFLEVSGSLCYRPLILNAGASVSAMFRVMDVIRGTLVLDEGDFAKSDESADISKLLNVGNQRRQGRISRSGSRDKNYETEFFNVYGPKVISTRKKYDDNAIESRCLTKEMGAPTSRKDIPRNLPDTFWTVEVPYMQGVLLKYRLEHWTDDLNSREIAIDELVEPRLQQVTDSLLKMVDDPAMAREVRNFIRTYNDQLVAGRGLQTEAKILEAIYILWEMQQNAEDETKRDFSMGKIAEVANDLIDYENGLDIHQWSRYKELERKRALSSRGVSKHVSTLQLKTERPSWDRRRRYHLTWDHDRIEGLWARYGIGGDEERMTLMETYFQTQSDIEEYEKKIHDGSQKQYEKPWQGTY